MQWCRVCPPVRHKVLHGGLPPRAMGRLGHAVSTAHGGWGPYGTAAESAPQRLTVSPGLSAGTQRRGSGSGFTFSAKRKQHYRQRHCQPLLQRPHQERSHRAATSPASTRSRFLGFGCYPTDRAQRCSAGRTVWTCGVAPCCTAVSHKRAPKAARQLCHN